MGKNLIEVDNEKVLVLFKAYSNLSERKIKELSSEALMFFMKENPIKNKSLILNEFVSSIKKNNK